MKCFFSVYREYRHDDIGIEPFRPLKPSRLGEKGVSAVYLNDASSLL